VYRIADAVQQGDARLPRLDLAQPLETPIPEHRDQDHQIKMAGPAAFIRGSG
jgi:hypothetical protein